MWEEGIIGRQQGNTAKIYVLSEHRVRRELGYLVKRISPQAFTGRNRDDYYSFTHSHLIALLLHHRNKLCLSSPHPPGVDRLVYWRKASSLIGLIAIIAPASHEP